MRAWRQGAAMARWIKTLFAQKMQHDLAFVRGAAVLEQIYSLPGSQHQLARGKGNGQVRGRQRRADMRRHVVGAFVSMDVTRATSGAIRSKKASRSVATAGSAFS